MKPKILSKKVVYKGDWLKVEKVKLKLPTTKIVNWERLLSSDGVAVVAIDNQKNIYLIKEWRVAWEKEILELPAGQCRGKTEKEILKQARKELREEAGLDAKKWEKLITCYHEPRKRMKIHIYLATNLFKSKKSREDTEIIEVCKLSFQKAYKLFLSGKELTTSYTLLGMNLAKERLKL